MLSNKTVFGGIAPLPWRGVGVRFHLLHFFLLLLPKLFFSQEVELNLSKGGSLYWQGNVYCYGFSGNAVFKLYKLSPQLKIEDSLNVELGKIRLENYLNVSADTLHNFLNIYLQEQEKKTVNILRFGKNFELLASIKQVDIARLNNTALFSSETVYYNNFVYNLKIESDTTGKQFYIDKYELKSEKENFDYQLKWQFPFEKKDIRSAHIFYADKFQVMVFVTIADGTKAGQWILSVNAATGMLIKGTKLNNKDEAAVYLYGNFLADKRTKSIMLIGQKFTEAQFNQKENKLNINNAPAASVYLANIDSMGVKTFNHEFKIPITSTSAGGQKVNGSYLLKIQNLKKNNEGSFLFETDIYKSTGNLLCWTYENTTLFKLLPGEEKPLFEKNTVVSNPMLTSFYFSNDKLDMNGKLCIDNMNNFEQLSYKQLTLPVKQQFKMDSTNNAAWILTKHNLRKNSISYSFLKPEKKIYRLMPVSEILKSNTPVFISLNNTAFIIATQSEENKYKLKLYNW